MNAVETASQEIDVSLIDEILLRYPCEPASLISVLQDLNEEMRYLPRPALERVAAALDVPLNQAYHVATFFKSFSLAPQGRHTVCVCEGTACHVKGADALMTALREHLGLDGEGVSPDGQFTLRAVRCLGCCALAPAVMVDHTVHGEVRPEDTAPLLAQHSDKRS